MKRFSLFVLLSCLFLMSSCSFEINKKGTLELPGLKEEVTVYNDKYGVPHIEAQNEEDMMMALGYITASDRLFQMDLLRRIGSGRLSEILGKELSQTDVLLRKLLLRRHMAERWKVFKKSAPPRMLRQIEAYMKGLNHYVKTGPRPVEMRILMYQPEPFSFEDSLAVTGYLTLNFAEGFFIDTLYSDLLDELPQKEVDLIFSRGSLDPDSLPLSAYKGTSPSKDYYATISSVVETLRESFFMFQGSNSWVLNGKRSASGKPLLANDPHIAFASPSVWYEAHIKCPSLESYGHYIPLIPFPGLSHNSKRAWAITMSNIDDLDFYKEKFHPENPNLVLYKNKYVPIKKYNEHIKVRGGKDIDLEVVVTPHGPVVDGTRFVKKGTPLAVKWQYLHEDNNIGRASYELLVSEELEDLAPALKHATSPGFNISFVDSKGNIGWHVMGHVPILQRQTNGRVILDGASGLDEYKGYLDIMDHPHIYNPESGVIVSANYKPLVKGKVPWIGLWQSKARLLQIEDLLSQQEVWSLEDFKTVQTDEKVPYYQHFKSLVLPELKPRTELEQKVYSILEKWDGSSQKDDVEPSVYYSFSLTLLQNVLKDEFGEERFKTYGGGADPYSFLYHILDHKESVLWDNVRTPKKESAQDILRATYSQTVDFLKSKSGKNPYKWHWGDLHTVTFKHPIGKIFPLNTILNLGPYPVGGGTEQINNLGAAKFKVDFAVNYGPSTRRLIDMADTSLSYGVLPTGNSGNVFSQHYGDQIPLYINNQYRKQIMDFKKLEGPLNKLSLHPPKDSLSFK